MPERHDNIIPIEDLVPGKWYRGVGRNFVVAQWDGQCFTGERFKFGGKFIDEELHWDTCERNGTFQPLELAK